MSRIGAARLRTGVIVLLAVPVTAASLIGAAPAAAAPMVGDCYDLTADELLMSQDWLQPEPVNCSDSHTFEVTKVGFLDMDAAAEAATDSESVDPAALAAEQCGPLGVWNEVGVNRSRAGIVTDPVRIEARSLAVRDPEPSYVCGAVAVEWTRRGDLAILPLTSSIEAMTPQEWDALRYCSRDRQVRRPWTDPATVDCTRTPRWEVTRWVLWAAFYDENPGRQALRARARDICGDDSRFSLPRLRDWSDGLPWTKCYERRI
jgi:hypothetical protein